MLATIFNVSPLALCNIARNGTCGPRPSLGGSQLSVLLLFQNMMQHRIFFFFLSSPSTSPESRVEFPPTSLTGFRLPISLHIYRPFPIRQAIQSRTQTRDKVPFNLNNSQHYIQLASSHGSKLSVKLKLKYPIYQYSFPALVRSQNWQM